MQRAVKLARFDLRPESMREWNYAIRGLDDNALLLAAEYARRAGLYDRAINTAERTACARISLRYMTPYRAQFGRGARAGDRRRVAVRHRAPGVALRRRHRVVRRRCRVDATDARHGALGREAAADADYSPARIADVDLNTQFGAFYFKYWQDRLGRLPALAAAAYNAGPSRAQAWRPAAASLEGAIWVETIPFNETRDYVKRVLANTMLYTRALDRPYVALTQRLGVVTPRDFDVVAATEQ